MEALKFRFKIPKERQLVLRIPEHIPENQMVDVFVVLDNEPATSSRQEVLELRDAMKDQLFVQDLQEVASDFSAVDLDSLKNSHGL
jgi:hypothetical protein